MVENVDFADTSNSDEAIMFAMIAASEDVTMLCAVGENA